MEQQHTVIVAVDEQDYHFRVRAHHHGDYTEYTVTPGEDADAVRDLVPQAVRLIYRNGEITYDERFQSDAEKALQYDIWRAVKEQILEQ